MLAKAKECWEQEHEEREAEKKRYLAERIPALQTRGTLGCLAVDNNPIVAIRVIKTFSV